MFLSSPYTINVQRHKMLAERKATCLSTYNISDTPGNRDVFIRAGKHGLNSSGQFFRVIIGLPQFGELRPEKYSWLLGVPRIGLRFGANHTKLLIVKDGRKYQALLSSMNLGVSSLEECALLVEGARAKEIWHWFNDRLWPASYDAEHALDFTGSLAGPEIAWSTIVEEGASAKPAGIGSQP